MKRIGLVLAACSVVPEAYWDYMGAEKPSGEELVILTEEGLKSYRFDTKG